MFLIKKMGWLILELVLFTVIFIALIGIQHYLMKAFGISNGIWNTENINESSSPFLLIPSFLPVLIAFSGASVLAYYIIMKHPFSDLGLIKYNALKLFGKGLVFSVILIVPGFLIMWVTGQIQLTQPDLNIPFFMGFFLFFFIQSTAEEVFTRSYLIPTFEGKLGSGVAIIISASLFGILHAGNDNFTWIGFINILLGGLVMALLFIYYRNIWICAGFHTGWNFVQASFFDFNVSGVDVYSLIQFQDVGYANITGSGFGYEGSLISILALGIALIFMFKKMNFEFKPMVWQQPVMYEQSENNYTGDSNYLSENEANSKPDLNSI